MLMIRAQHLGDMNLYIYFILIAIFVLKLIFILQLSVMLNYQYLFGRANKKKYAVLLSVGLEPLAYRTELQHFFDLLTYPDA